jgi:hypothetical protein
MKTAEITRHKQAATGVKPPSTWALFFEIFRKEGIRGVNKGVNAVAVRQCTNWGSRQVNFFPLSCCEVLTFGSESALLDLQKRRFVECAARRKVNLLVPLTRFSHHQSAVLWLRGTSLLRLSVLRYLWPRPIVTSSHRCL